MPPGRTVFAQLMDHVSRYEFQKCVARYGGEYNRISDLPVVPYRQDQSPHPDFWGSDVRNHTTEDDTRWVNYSMRRFSSRSMAS